MAAPLAPPPFVFITRVITQFTTAAAAAAATATAAAATTTIKKFSNVGLLDGGGG